MINKRLINTGVAAAAPFDPLQNFETVTYTGSGGTQKITGYIRKGAAFNGSNSKIDVPTITANSISFWVYLNNFSSSHAIFGNSSDTSKYLYIDTDGTVLINTQTDLTPSTSIQSGTWEHITLTESGGTVTMYLNGQSVGTVSSTLGGWNQIGARTSGTAQYLDGKLDQVRIFNTALNSTQVGQLADEEYGDAKNSVTDFFGDGSGIALYELDEDANTTPYYPYGTGAIDSGLSAVFNGGSSYIETTNNFGLSGNVDFTLSCWIKVDSLITGRILDMWNGTTAPNNCIFFQLDNGRLAFDQYAETYVSGTDINVGVWNHVAFTRQTNNIGRFYINGVEIDSHTYSSNINLISDPLIIGKASNNQASYYFDGSIDQVRIYSSALSASDIEALASETNVPTANLVAHYKLDGTANDETGTYNGITSNITYSDPAEFPLVAYNGTPTNVNFLGMAFQPDFVWIKNRDAAYNHAIYDSVRGAEAPLFPNTTSAEDSDVGDTYGLKSFDSNGFTLGYNGAITNTSGNNFVAWCWKAGGTAVSNTNGSINSTVSANQAAGFSIVSYTGNGIAGATVGHGLNSAPNMYIIKDRDTVSNWRIYHSSLGSALKGLEFNTNAAGSNVILWNDTEPTSSVFSLGYFSDVNANGKNFIAYCFHSVDGYQKLGSYTGNSPSSNIITTGFRPRFVLIKRTSLTGSWHLVDNVRSSNVTTTSYLFPNSSGTEVTTNNDDIIKFLNNGFEVVSSTGGEINANGETFIYLAIA